MPSRRVRQVEREGPERRKEFVQDVAEGVGDEEDQQEENSFAAGAGASE
jgi:hypothetical protein